MFDEITSQEAISGFPFKVWINLTASELELNPENDELKMVVVLKKPFYILSLIVQTRFDWENKLKDEHMK